MPRIRMIAMDLDGTLLDDRKRIPPDNREALLEAEGRGLLISIASGRMISRIETIERQLGIDSVIISYNGGKLWGRRSEGRPLIAHQPLAVDVAEHLIRYSREQGYPLNFYHEDRLFAESSPSRSDLRELYSARTGAPYDYVPDLLASFPGIAPTKLILLAYPEECARMLPQLRAELQGRAFITMSEPEYLEIMAAGVNKGSTLPLMAAHYGMTTDEILAIGDADNDLDMLRVAGVGVAVANAPAHVKAAATFITSRTNNEAGAAEAIRRWAYR